MQQTNKVDFNEVLDVKKIKVLGYTTDYNQCDCCGREGLKGTISILDFQTDIVLHFGTGCAASAEKYDTLNAIKEVKKWIREAMKEYNNEQLRKEKEALELRISEARDLFKMTSEYKDCSSIASTMDSTAEQIFIHNKLYAAASIVRDEIMMHLGLDPKQHGYKMWR